jgi:hypothetical protein
MRHTFLWENQDRSRDHPHQFFFCGEEILSPTNRISLCKLNQYMPEFEIKKEDLCMFPEAIIADELQVLVGSDLTPGSAE